MINKQKTQFFLKQVFLLFLAVAMFVLQQPNSLFKNGISFLAWFVYIPVLFLIKNSSLKFSWIWGGVYGALCYGFLGYWVIHYGTWGIVALSGGYFIVLSLLFLFIKIIDKFFIRLKFVLFFLILVSYEYIKTLGFLGLNYGVSAYSQWQNIKLIQICDIIGVFGLNAIIIFSSCLLFEFLNNYIQKKSLKSYFDSFVALGIYAVILLFVCVYGNVVFNKSYGSKTIKAAAIQHNENPFENGIESYNKNINTLINLSKSALEENPDVELIVWPETSVVPSVMYQFYERKEPKRLELITNMLDFMKSSDAAFIIGNGTTIIEKNNSIKNYNSALYFANKLCMNPPVPEIYYKTKLVPFSEYFPYKKIFPHLYKYLQKHEKNMWDKGSEEKVFNYEDLYFSTPICFEDTFSSNCRKMYLNGARCFINLSNDSWSKNVACQNQHLSMAVFRCVENRVPEIRSCTSGQTCIISPNGKITEQAPAFTQTYAAGEITVISKDRKPTLYTKYGDVIPVFSIMLFFVMLIMKIFLVILRKTNI